MTIDATITPQSVTSRDAYNDDVLTAGTPVAVKCWLEQQGRSEDTGEDIVEETFRVFLPAGTAVDANDRITVNDETYEVIGPPWSAQNPRLRRVTHIEATARRVA